MELIFVLAASFGFGLIFGSFLNVLISRFPREMADLPVSRGNFVFLGRSYCDRCKKKLRWFELVPLFSFIFAGGKCFRCKEAIPFRYCVTELWVGLSFLLLAYALLHLQSVNGIETNVLTSSLMLGHILALYAGLFALLAIFLFDLYYMYIPNAFVGMIVLAGLWESFLKIHITGGETALSIGGAVLGVGLFFFSLWYFTKGRGMGFGDVKLAAAVPLFLGSFEGIVSMLLAFWLGAAVALTLMLFQKRGVKDEIPFGPFLVLGALLVFAFPEISSWLLFLQYAP